MKRNQESRRSLFLQYDLPTSLTSPEATAITLHTGHLLAENTVKEVAVRCISSAFQGCNHSQYCISVSSVPFKESWRLRKRAARFRFQLICHDSRLKLTLRKGGWNVLCAMRPPTSSIAQEESPCPSVSVLDFAAYPIHRIAPMRRGSSRNPEWSPRATQRRPTATVRLRATHRRCRHKKRRQRAWHAIRPRSNRLTP